MNKKLLSFSLLGLSLISLMGCGQQKVDPKKSVTVNFYIDFNYAAEKEVYHTTSVYLNDVISDVPANPSSNMFNEFPTFLGWSTYQIINDSGDLWNFAHDRVSTTYSVFSLYGIWSE